ncbi:unnamed protein product [Miscanthus lutarioriparius]|uniref:Uncharacterized protein n=1 Tax=Miscanthus lutarioriparius TaxID=422564 RepID=A0A811QMK4_9POAL|nr:unnamed protein product [Miscanthus lutarioriparius]
MKVKLLFPYAVSCVFGGMGRAWGMAMVGLHVVLCIIKVLSFTTDPEVARFWVPIFRVWVYLGIAAIVLMTCVNIVYYMPVYGVYAMNYDLPPQQPAAAISLLVLDHLFSICLGTTRNLEDASGASGFVIKWSGDKDNARYRLVGGIEHCRRT